MRIIPTDSRGSRIREPAKDPAPRSILFPHLGRDGSPNRILERYPPHEALERVTAEHATMADWIRDHKGKEGWDLSSPTSEQWRYIHVSKMLKRAREELRLMVDAIDIGRDIRGEVSRAKAERDDARSSEEYMHTAAQAEADLLSALEEKARGDS